MGRAKINFNAAKLTASKNDDRHQPNSGSLKATTCNCQLRWLLFCRCAKIDFCRRKKYAFYEVRSSHHTSWNQNWACNENFKITPFQNRWFPYSTRWIWKGNLSILYWGPKAPRLGPVDILLMVQKSPPPGMVLKPWDITMGFSPIYQLVSFPDFWSINMYYHPLTWKNVDPEVERNHLNQPSIFSGYVSFRAVISYIHIYIYTYIYIFVMCEYFRLSHGLREIRRTGDPVSDQAPLGTPTLPVAMSWAFPTSPRKQIAQPLAGWEDYMAPMYIYIYICCWHFA